MLKTRSRSSWILSAFSIGILGMLATVFAVHYTNTRLRESLLTRAKTIAAAVNTDDLKSLSGTPADTSTSVYQDLKQAMINIRRVNPDERFVYLMGIRDGQLFFYVDSEPSESEDYSAPGDVYADASPFKIRNAMAGIAFTEGPYTDVWGTWISGYAPIFDSQDSAEKQNLLGIVGVDIGAHAWREAIAYATALPLIISFFIEIILWLYYRSRERQQKYLSAMKEEEEKLRLQEARLRALYEITTRPDLSSADQIRAALNIGAEALHTKLAILSHIEGAQFTVVHCHGGDLKEGDVFPLAETYCDITVKKNDVVAIDDMQTSPYNAHACYQRFKLDSYIGVPVTVNGERYGTLTFSDPDPHRPVFSASDEDFLRLMGKWVSTTLERDIIHEKEMEISKMKSEFVSVASHQLRTPLTGIKWFAELLLKSKAGELTPEQKDFVQQMFDSNERMITLVNDLLNVSRIETGKKFSIEPVPTNVVPLIEGVVKEHQIIAEKRGVTLKLAGRWPKDMTLNVDADKLRQVFQNLVSNAIKYSKEVKGHVTLACDRTSEPGMTVFSVKDNGVGIPKGQQEKIFQKFFRAENVLNGFEGTGLGLYIAKAIVEGHNGKIWFESDEGKGTTFFISLPT